MQNRIEKVSVTLPTATIKHGKVGMPEVGGRELQGRKDG